MRLLKKYPNLLKDLEKLVDLFLLELIGLEDHTLMKTKSMLLSSMHSEDACSNTEEEEETPQAMTTLMEDLLIMSLMA